MPRPPLNRDNLIVCHSLRRRKMKFLIILYFFMLVMISLLSIRIRMTLKQPSWYDPTIRLKHLNDMIARNDILCIEQLRMDRRCFRVLCSLVREYGGLQDTKNMNVEEMVAVFLHIIAFDEKNREIKFSFQRSQETISRHFNNVLRAILKLWKILLTTPQPIPTNSTDERWKWFKVFKLN
ncbi:unnamed protein product [Amaranthus hypochondriacus]